MRYLLSFPKNIYQMWIWLLMLSFSYERPIYIISSLDRMNPRLLDVVLLIGIFLMSMSKTRAKKNPVFNRWALLVLWFSICTICSAIFFDFPDKINQYMFFFLFSYLKGLLIIYLVLKIPENKIDINQFIIPLIYGGVFVATYCVYEMFLGVEQFFLTDNLIINKPSYMVWGPFSSTYFHIAVYIPLVSSIVFSRFLIESSKEKLFWFILTCYISWPVFFSGSRTGIALLFLSFLFIIWNTKKNFKTIFIIILTAILSYSIIQKYVFTEDNYTYQRAVNMSSDHEHNSIVNRVLLFSEFNINKYDKSEWMPFVGSGFYVAPINDGRFRVGYGFHNIFVFVFEQSGFFGFIIFIIFIIFCIRKLRRFLLESKRKDASGRWIVNVSYSYFLACLIIGFSGHSFWYGFNTGEFQTLRILMLVIAVNYVMCYQKNSIN